MNTAYDVIVMGGGHAGVEASLAASRLGCRVAMVTLRTDKIGYMPCNPSIGGPAKGQIVGEIDALGGAMGYAADQTHIQMKVLNRSRGPAVQCLRAQSDKADYNQFMVNLVTSDPNVDVIEDEVVGLVVESMEVVGIHTKTAQYSCKSFVLTSGTFMNGVMHTGLQQSSGGRVGEASVRPISDWLHQYFKLGRLKTGTPPRLDKDTINYDALVIQPGDDEWLRFSFNTPYSDRYKHQKACHLSRTNDRTHSIILGNLDRSPMYTNVIQGKGPRYCPSIEDKVVRFKDNPSHHIFIEPEGWTAQEVYPQGLNTSLPEDVQEALVHSMVGLEEATILRYGYAVEYDFVYPSQLNSTLETRSIKGLFLAGQINGTSGYEEAAGQGLIAGINAGLKSQGRDPFVLSREDSFIGTMIDDLITKDIYEPYRMLTSRSEYSLLLRQDNATRRLSERGFDIGLLTHDQIEKIRQEHNEINECVKRWRKESTSPEIMTEFGLSHKKKLTDIIKRPELTIDHELFAGQSAQQRDITQKALVEVKYAGYVAKQEQDILKIQQSDKLLIPEHINVDQILGLKEESRQKIKDYKPKTIYDAKRIAGINPADIMILIGYLTRRTYSAKMQ